MDEHLESEAVAGKANQRRSSEIGADSGQSASDPTCFPGRAVRERRSSRSRSEHTARKRLVQCVLLDRHRRPPSASFGPAHKIPDSLALPWEALKLRQDCPPETGRAEAADQSDASVQDAAHSVGNDQRLRGHVMIRKRQWSHRPQPTNATVPLDGVQKKRLADKERLAA
jgi:hypothetical protein